MATWSERIDPAEHAPRLRAALGGIIGLTEKRMFGGLCFLVKGNMLCGIGKPGFMFRIDPDEDDRMAQTPGAEPMVQGGRRMRGFIWVDPRAIDDAALAHWLSLARAHVDRLPEKAARKR